MKETAQESLLMLEWETWDVLDFLELPEREEDADDDLEDDRELPE